MWTLFFSLLFSHFYHVSLFSWDGTIPHKWLETEPWCLNERPHLLQENGVSPVCLTTCRSSKDLKSNVLSQKSQRNTVLGFFILGVAKLETLATVISDNELLQVTELWGRTSAL